jgi:hypothetical protein
MKCIFYLWVAILFLACSNKEPFSVPLEPTQVWIDEDTQSDTIITGEGYTIPNYLYYAAKSWQTSADTNLTHGFRNIAVKFGDSILVKPLHDPSTIYEGPFFFRVDESRTTLHTQNFLNTSRPNEVRIFVPLR